MTTTPVNVNMTDHSQTPPKSWMMRVDYQFAEGYHIFTSEDLYGLYIASKDPGKALNALCPTIEFLVRYNLKMNLKAELVTVLCPLSEPGPVMMENKFVYLRAA